MAICNTCRVPSLNNPQLSSLPSSFLYAAGLPLAETHHKPELESYLLSLFQFNTSSPTLFITILREVTRYHTPCITHILQHRFMTLPIAPSYINFKATVDELIPIVSEPDMQRDVAYPVISASNRMTDEQRLNDNFRIVLLAWLFDQQFGDLASASEKEGEFSPFKRTTMALQGLRDLARIVSGYLGVIHHIAFTTMGAPEQVDLGDGNCVASAMVRGVVHPRRVDVVEMLVRCMLDKTERRVRLESKLGLTVWLHLAIRRGGYSWVMPRLFSGERKDVVDLLVRWEERGVFR
ncbi:hypothetical protein QBC34DRAFT_391033 [Podospora aff. communis PSN243]|uniref:Uncharacterized protein n=1 Tax=Podospora aff. communis PSN243 TaxID=3040156 RepID=A0AAV9H2J5_9PEZI|nr:hypothetical protein QBC34DRAFT_391033 [Podospora aff. communis PSN243]